MTHLYLTHPELRAEQDQARRAWQAKDAELRRHIGKLFYLAGLLAGAEWDAIEGVLGGSLGLSTAEVDAASEEALSVLNDRFADASDKQRHFRELYELTAQVLTAHEEAGLASSDFVNALQSELRHWVSKRKNERRPA